MPEFEKPQDYYDCEFESETGMGTALAKEEQMARITARSRLSVLREYVAPRRLLDVGCATGVFLDEASGWADCEGIDLSRTAVAEARSKQLKAHVATVEHFAPQAPYDIITGFDVIEHLLNPVSFLRAIRRLLQPSGILALTTPDTYSLSCRLMGHRWYFYIPEQHLFCFNRNNITKGCFRVWDLMF